MSLGFWRGFEIIRSGVATVHGPAWTVDTFAKGVGQSLVRGSGSRCWASLIWFRLNEYERIMEWAKLSQLFAKGNDEFVTIQIKEPRWRGNKVTSDQ
jgi:hypothetical protein